MGWARRTEDTEDRDINLTRGAREQWQRTGPGAIQPLGSQERGAQVEGKE